MRKSLIIPILGLVILGISAFVFLNKNEGTGNKDIALPSSLFNTADFYDIKTINQKKIFYDRHPFATAVSSRLVKLRSMGRIK